LRTGVLRTGLLRAAAPHPAVAPVASLCAGSRLTAVLGMAAALFCCIAVASAAQAAEPPAPSSGARIEARSAELLAVGTVQGNRMVIHLSRIADNAPVRDASVTVVLRGTPHPAVAEADGGYSVTTPDLELPGPAAAEFQVVSGDKRQDLAGTLQIADRAGPSEEKGKGGARQFGWWILNFAVCIGFLMLWSRRKKRDDEEESAP
jgi:hypothetical protein